MDLHHILPQLNITSYSLDQDGTPGISISPPTTPIPDIVPWCDTDPMNTTTTTIDPKNITTTFTSSQSSSPSPRNKDWWMGKYDFAAKIIILGDYGVGKSSFLTTLGSVKDMGWCRCLGFKPNEYVEMECTKNNKKILIRLMDTGGQERFRSMTSSYFRGAHGCLLMFNVCKEESFNNLINWFNDLGVYAAPDGFSHVSAMVVGNTSAPLNSERQVTAEKAFRLAESLGLSYCETHVRDDKMALCVLTRLVNSVIINRVRRQSLAITIMPSLSVKEKYKAGREKRRWRCCLLS